MVYFDCSIVVDWAITVADYQILRITIATDYFISCRMQIINWLFHITIIDCYQTHRMGSIIAVVSRTHLGCIVGHRTVIIGFAVIGTAVAIASSSCIHFAIIGYTLLSFVGNFDCFVIIRFGKHFVGITGQMDWRKRGLECRIGLLKILHLQPC